MLGFLLEAMPKEEGDAVEEVLGQNVIRNRLITETLQSWAQKSWLPDSCRPLASRPKRMKTVPILTPEPQGSGNTAARESYYTSAFLPLATKQGQKREYAVNSILEVFALSLHLVSWSMSKVSSFSLCSSLQATNAALFANVEFDNESNAAAKLSKRYML